MAWLPLSLRKTLVYFDKYDYPLTLDELRYWNSPISPSSVPPLTAKPRTESEKLRGGKEKGVIYKNGYYFLPGRSRLVKLRHQREKFSKAKWLIAKKVGESLKKFPTISAVFVTGALAMNNCPKDDDIDLMIITYPNTLWITRLFVNLYLWRLRRFPGQTSAPDKICPNLWLDTNNLVLHTHNIYTAHEILQAKCIFDRGSVHHQFLTQNSWVKKYLPNAYLSLLKLPSPTAKPRAREILGEGLRVRYWLWSLNLLFFAAQYAYMLPKMTTEKVSLHSAFFHPTVINLDKKRK